MHLAFLLCYTSLEWNFLTCPQQKQIHSFYQQKCIEVAGKPWYQANCFSSTNWCFNWCSNFKCLSEKHLLTYITLLTLIFFNEQCCSCWITWHLSLDTCTWVFFILLNCTDGWPKSLSSFAYSSSFPCFSCYDYNKTLCSHEILKQQHIFCCVGSFIFDFTPVFFLLFSLKTSLFTSNFSKYIQYI